MSTSPSVRGEGHAVVEAATPFRKVRARTFVRVPLDDDRLAREIESPQRSSYLIGREIGQWQGSRSVRSGCQY